MVGEPLPATFGFVDLAGFTALTEAHGDQEAVALLDRFERLVDTALAGSGERVKSIGDAVMLRFPDPATAVAILARVFAGCADEPAFPLPRAGLHHGPALARDGDWFGATVNLAARVAGQAHGGQLLATAEVAAAARGAGFTVIELGGLQLRNLSKPVELFHVEVCPALAGTALDPVCRMQVSRADAAGRLRHHQHDFWFCSLDCVSRFSADPDRYTAAAGG